MSFGSPLCLLLSNLGHFQTFKGILKSHSFSTVSQNLMGSPVCLYIIQHKLGNGWRQPGVMGYFSPYLLMCKTTRAKNWVTIPFELLHLPYPGPISPIPHLQSLNEKLCEDGALSFVYTIMPSLTCGRILVGFKLKLTAAQVSLFLHHYHFFHSLSFSLIPINIRYFVLYAQSIDSPWQDPWWFCQLRELLLAFVRASLPHPLMYTTM